MSSSNGKRKLPRAVDVCVVGSGLAGLCAALAAKELGLRPILIEKDALLGGGTAVSAGNLWVGNNAFARRAGYTDSREAVLAYMRWVGGGDIDERRLLAFVDQSPRSVNFFVRCGIKLQLIPMLGDHYADRRAPGSVRAGRALECVPISALELGPWKDRVRQSVALPELAMREIFPSGGLATLAAWDPALLAEVAERRGRAVWAQGQGLVAHFVKQLLRRKVPIHSETAAARLIRDNGRVGGVETSTGETIVVKKGVVLTTGGYESNPALAQRYEGLPGWESMFPAGLTGDALTLAGDLGAAVKVIRNNAALFLGFRTASNAQGERPFQLVSVEELVCPHTLMVNRAGDRFGDESFFQHVVRALRRYDGSGHTYTNLPCYLIFDRQFTQNYSFAREPAGVPIPDWVERADTLAGLAARLGIDAPNLERTVERFNGFARLGHDPDFHRGETNWGQDPSASNGTSSRNPRLGGVSEPPFYGVELHPSAFASAGLHADAHARVLDVRGVPITGLYAAGNAAAHTEYGVGYQGGHSLASAMTFAHLAIRDML